MHPSYSDIFAILRQSLFPSDHSDTVVSPSSDWDTIYSEMQLHTVSSLAYPWLKKHTIPNPDIQDIWIASCLQQQTRWIQVMHAQEQLINLMEQHNIPTVIIKGAATMMYYPHPTMRAAGDVDFLVKREDFGAATEILKNNGYHLEYENNPENHHLSFEKNGISFELHKRLAIIKDTDEELLCLFETGINNRTWHNIGIFNFPTLPTDLNGLVLLFHINQHLRSGLGLRQIIDWMMYVYQNDNLNDLIPIIRSTGMEKLANTTTVMCQKYLGLPHMIDESDDYPCDELMEYILSKGNFGIISGTKGKISSVSLVIPNPIRLFSRLQRGGLCRWNAVKKYRVLRPFAWMYQIIYIIRELIRTKISITSFIHSHQDGLEQRNLINKLGLDIERNIDSLQ